MKKVLVLVFVFCVVSSSAVFAGGKQGNRGHGLNVNSHVDAKDREKTFHVKESELDFLFKKMANHNMDYLELNAVKFQLTNFTLNSFPCTKMKLSHDEKVHVAVNAISEFVEEYANADYEAIKIMYKKHLRSQIRNQCSKIISSR